MDANEVSRIAADRLHRQAVAVGHDPCDPYRFVSAEAARRNLVVERLPRGDVRLHGGLALYDPDALLILHEATGDEFTDAFLVAHEIGHAELGGEHQFSATAGADPLRSSDAVPVGVDRVVDYNRKERREVQMDLFAREFLLPRSWLRRLHLEEGATATAISQKSKAPFGVVAQQLFDALLLPAVAPAPERAVAAKPLNPDQLQAVRHREKPYLLEAGPGTGKTQTLVARVHDLLADQIAPENILVLTFSNRAAGELSERITQKTPEASTRMWIGTFHAFGLDLVRRFHDRLGLPVEPRLIDRTDAIELLENDYPRLDLVHFKNLWDPAQPLNLILNAISRANDEVVDSAQYLELSERMLKSAATSEQKSAAQKSIEVGKVFAAYERLKLENGCVDFGDLVSMPVRLCEASPEIREHLTALYHHVLVDEFQDVNRSSIRLLKAITRDGTDLWAVGDAKQSIYRFRGASSFNMRRFGGDDFPGGARGRLTVNYRSVPEVRDAFLRFAADMRVVDGADVALQTDRTATAQFPEYRAVDTDDQEIAAVAEAIEELRAAGHDYRHQAILCSGNERLARMAQGLEQLKVPVLYLGILFERSEIKDLLCLLSIIVDRRAMGLLRVAAMDQFQVDLADVDRVLAFLKDSGEAPLQWTGKLESIKGLTPDGIAGLKRIAQLVQDFPINADPWTVVAAILLDRTRVVADIATQTDVVVRSRGIAIWQFMNFLRAQPVAKGLPIARVLERIRRLVLHADDRELRQLPASAQGIDAVRLMTMHGSKGLEFEVVHIPGLTAASLPRSPAASLARTIVPPDGMIEGATGSAADASKEAILDEQECLFFVALSRARDRLLLYSPTKSANGNARPCSPFIDRLSGTVRLRRTAPAQSIPPAAGEAPLPIELEGPFSFTDYQLALYERCPRRFLYTHVLDIGGRRSETAFMKLHVAVQEVVDLLTQRSGAMPSFDEIEQHLAEVWETRGPVDHGYADEYKRIARQLIRFFIDSGAAMKPLASPQLRFPIAGGEIVIEPDQVLADTAGQVHMRRVRTGHKPFKDEENLAAAAFRIAASAHTPGCTVQLVYLSDASVTPVKMTERVLKNRAESIAAKLAAVKGGYFPLNESMTCPRCPAYFVCGRVPAGALIKKISA